MEIQHATICTHLLRATLDPQALPAKRRRPPASVAGVLEILRLLKSASVNVASHNLYCTYNIQNSVPLPFHFCSHSTFCEQKDIGENWCA